MKRAGRAALLACALATGTGAAPDPQSLYGQGKYEQAVTAASALNTAAGYALATRAALADAAMRNPCLDCLKRAEQLARKSIAADTALADGHVYLAVALGYQARIVGLVRARLAGDAEQAKANLDAALAIDPHNAWALAALGGWNMEIVRNGGAYLAQWLYGATVEDGMKSFAASFKSAPDNLVLHYQYALSLAGFDLDAYRDAVVGALVRAAGGHAATAYDRFAQGRARELLAALRKDDRETFDALVRRDQGYP